MEPEQYVPFLIISIPIIAIVGGITAGIIRTIGRQRLVEMAQRERIAAIEKGVDPSTLPPLPGLGGDGDDPFQSRYDVERQRTQQGLLIGGVIVTAAGFGIALFLLLISSGSNGSGGNAWAVGIIPTFVGIAMLISARLLRPRNGNGST